MTSSHEMAFCVWIEYVQTNVCLCCCRRANPSHRVSSNPANGPITLQQEGGDGADRLEREAMQRSHSQLPYFLGKPAQEHTVIKSGYCVKQGAVVSSHPMLLARAGRRPPPGLLTSCVKESLEAVETDMICHNLPTLTPFYFFLDFSSLIM